ncbi:MAG: hypothetical protein WC379_15300 [Methanoregula sp.]
MVSDEDLEKIFLLLRRPIPWDPGPPWLHIKDLITKEEITRIAVLQHKANAATLRAKAAIINEQINMETAVADMLAEKIQQGKTRLK